MPSFEFVKKTDKQTSFRVEKVVGMFDLHEDHLVQKFQGVIDYPEDWSTGLIVGRSGTGKTVIAETLYDIYNTTYSQKPIIDEMPQEKTIDDITKIFTRVGFSSPPNWLKPYQNLSNGEKMRVDLAKALLENKETIVFDEFTSVVDRDVAKVVSMVVSKTMKETSRKFVGVTCHYDVIDWLDPDWVFSTDTMTMFQRKKKDQKLTSISIQQQYNTGKYLKTITI